MTRYTALVTFILSTVNVVLAEVDSYAPFPTGRRSLMPAVLSWSFAVVGLISIVRVLYWWFVSDGSGFETRHGLTVEIPPINVNNCFVYPAKWKEHWVKEFEGHPYVNLATESEYKIAFDQAQNSGKPIIGFQLLPTGGNRELGKELKAIQDWCKEGYVISIYLVEKARRYEYLKKAMESLKPFAGL